MLSAPQGQAVLQYIVGRPRGNKRLDYAAVVQYALAHPDLLQIEIADQFGVSQGLVSSILIDAGHRKRLRLHHQPPPEALVPIERPRGNMRRDYEALVPGARRPTGRPPGSGRLNHGEIIQYTLAHPELLQREIAAHFGIHQSQISIILIRAGHPRGYHGYPSKKLLHMDAEAQKWERILQNLGLSMARGANSLVVSSGDRVDLDPQRSCTMDCVMD